MNEFNKGLNRATELINIAYSLTTQERQDNALRHFCDCLIGLIESHKYKDKNESHS